MSAALISAENYFFESVFLDVNRSSSALRSHLTELPIDVWQPGNCFLRWRSADTDGLPSAVSNPRYRAACSLLSQRGQMSGLSSNSRNTSEAVLEATCSKNASATAPWPV